MKLSSVLIIDDCEPDQFISKTILENYDCEIKISQAYDGQEALELLDSLKEQPCLILLDINMPRMNGFEFLEEYEKRDDADQNIIIMLTSSDQEDDQKKAMSHQNVKGYFTKPINEQNLDEARTLLMEKG